VDPQEQSLSLLAVLLHRIASNLVGQRNHLLALWLLLAFALVAQTVLLAVVLVTRADYWLAMAAVQHSME
jgi:hypothetical protein